MKPLALVLLVAACGAAPRSARDFIVEVYRSHDPMRAGDAPWSEARCPATFTARLCDLMARDRREAGDEVPRLDGDPLYDAQDFQIEKLAIAAERQATNRADIAVTFTNAGKPIDLLVSVVREAGSWRIDEIVYRSERPPLTLTQILTTP